MNLNQDDQWIKKFIFWELEVIKLVGYDINFSEYIDNNDLSKDLTHISTIDGSKKILLF